MSLRVRAWIPYPAPNIALPSVFLVMAVKIAVMTTAIFFCSVVGRRILRWSDLKSCVSFAFVINHPFLSFYKIFHRSLLFLRQKCLSTQLHTGCAPAPKAMSTTTPSFSEHQHFTFIIVFSIWIRHFHELVLIGISFCPHSYLKLDIKWCNYVFREDINEKKNVFFRALPELA